MLAGNGEDVQNRRNHADREGVRIREGGLHQCPCILDPNCTLHTQKLRSHPELSKDRLFLKSSSAQHLSSPSQS
jgi:hypothetical protein